MIGKVRILWYKRTMHIGSISITIHSPFSMIFCVVSVALEYLPQWFGRAKIGTASMIFETDQCAAVPTYRHVSNAPWGVRSLMNGPRVEYSKPFHVWPLSGSIKVCQQLVATTDRKHWHIVFNCSP